MRLAASNAAQNPKNGPKENGKATTSSAVVRVISKICRQQDETLSQLAGVSSQRSGALVVPDV